MENKIENMNTNENENVEKVRKPHRRLNPIAKWIAIGIGGFVVIGGITYLIVKGKHVPVQAVEKIGEVATEVIAAA